MSLILPLFVRSLTLMYSTALEMDQYRSSEMRQMLRIDAVQSSTSTAECILWGDEQLATLLAIKRIAQINISSLHLHKGPFTNDVSQIFGILDPLPPPCQYQIHATSLPFVRNWPTPSPPLTADVICTSSLMKISTSKMALLE